MSKFDGDPPYYGGPGAPPQSGQYNNGGGVPYGQNNSAQFGVPNYGGQPQYPGQQQYGGGGPQQFGGQQPQYSGQQQYGGGGPQQFGGQQPQYPQQQPQYGGQQQSQYGQQQPPYSQQPPYDGRQTGQVPAVHGPPPPQGPPLAYASQPMQPLQHGPGPYPVRPYAPGLQQPSGVGPQGQGQLSGRKRAVLCGCNYKGTSAQLNGCINDAKCMQYLLEKRFGFQGADIRLLTDDNPGAMPTRANIVAAIHWLVDHQQPGDDLFFHFSGHGSQEPDPTGEETSGLNDTVLPCDYKTAGQISDNELNQRLANPLRQGVRLHAVIDACHSGSALDLPFRCKVKGGTPVWKEEYLAGRARSHKGTAGGLAIQIAAAGDKETAADTSALSGTSTGAATYSFIQAIEQIGPSITYGQLLMHMDKILHNMGGGSSSVGGMLSSFGLDKMLGGSSGGSKILGYLEGGLSAAGLRGGQTPQISANYAFDLNTRLQM